MLHFCESGFIQHQDAYMLLAVEPHLFLKLNLNRWMSDWHSNAVVVVLHRKEAAGLNPPAGWGISV